VIGVAIFWRLSQPSLAKITFTYVDIETNGSACFDFLEITGAISSGEVCGEPDGDEDTGTGLEANSCFYNPVAGQPITVVFESDFIVGETGFSFEFTCETLLADAAFCPGTAFALPVELTSFTGKTMSKTNMLEWTTASEENTEWHIIERSKDGRSDWTEIGRTEAKGFSNELISYQLEDEKPMAKSYYRLRSVDYDGYEDLSKVVYLKRNIERFDIIKVYPVPTTKMLNVDFEIVQDEEVEIRLTDMLGKIITIRPIEAFAGVNTEIFDMSNLANGIYFVSINNGQEKISKRVIKN